MVSCRGVGWAVGIVGTKGRTATTLYPLIQINNAFVPQVQCLNGLNAYFWNFMAKCYHFSFFCSYKVVLENFFYCLVSEFS